MGEAGMPARRASPQPTRGGGTSLLTRTLLAFLAALAVLLALLVGAAAIGVGWSARNWTAARGRETSSFLESLVLASWRSTGRLDPDSIATATLPYLGESSYLFVFAADGSPVFAWRRGERLDTRGSGGGGGGGRNFLRRHAAEAQLVELRDGQRVIGSIAAGALSFGEEAANQRFLRTLGLVGGIGAGVSFLLAVAVAFLFSSRLASHAAGLAAGLARLAAGERGVAFETRGARELSLIGSSADALQAQLQHEERLRGQWTADIAHDLRTPLAALRSQLEAMTDGVLPATPERFSRASAELARIEALVADLGELARIESPELKPRFSRVEAASFLEDIGHRFGLEAERQGVTLSFAATPGLSLSADGSLLMRAVSNVVENAIRHAGKGGRVSVACSASAAEAGGRPGDRSAAAPMTEIRVENSGSIDEEEIPRVFDRLYRGDRARSSAGSGLGLTIAKAIIERHGGTISIANTGEGSVLVTMLLPDRPEGSRAE